MDAGPRVFAAGLPLTKRSGIDRLQPAPPPPAKQLKKVDLGRTKFAHFKMLLDAIEHLNDSPD
jgi:hypothetical protein